MMYAQWVANVLEALDIYENDFTRLVGVPAPGLRESLYVDLSDVDAIEDALYDLDVLGLVQRRPADTFNLTSAGREAARSACSVRAGSRRARIRGLRALAD